MAERARRVDVVAGIDANAFYDGSGCISYGRIKMHVGHEGDIDTIGQQSGLDIA